MDEQIEVDVELTPADSSKRRGPVLAMVGGVVVFAALLVGAYVATSDDNPKDVTVADDLVEESDDASNDDADADADADDADVEDRDLPADAETTATSESAAQFLNEAADSSFYGGGPNEVIFDGTRFVAIGFNESGSTLRTSVDGVTWDEKPFPGLPENASVYHLAEHNGALVAVVEEVSFEETPDDSVERYFGPVGGSKQYLASSTDLETWTLTELPSADQSDGPVFVGINGLAVGDSGVVILTQQHNEGNDEMRVLFEAGILNEGNIDRFCGIDFDDSEASTVYTVSLCNFEAEEDFWVEFEDAIAAAETEEERAEIERGLEEDFPESQPEVIATIAPGDALYDELEKTFESYEQPPESTVISGPLTGPFVEAPLPAKGYATGLVEVTGTYIAIVQNWGDEYEGRSLSTLIHSTDGVNWTEGGALPNGFVERLSVAGSSLVAIGHDERGGSTSYLSTDRGATWSETGITSELYGTYAQTVDGPAGIAMMVQGSTEPYPEFEPPEDISITRDGYILTISFSEEGGRSTLVGPDGAEIYVLTDEQMYSGNADDVVRVSRLTGTPTFLDPETGEDLVTFSNEDFENAYGLVDVEEDYEEIEQGSEVWFSVDGTTWEQITDPRLVIGGSESDVQLIAVGDDEVIFAKHTWIEPPTELFAFEEEGREPNEEEMAALDAFYEDTNEDAVEYIRIEVG